MIITKRTAVLMALAAALAMGAGAQSATKPALGPVCVDGDGVAVGGMDVVSYHQDGPVEGKAEITAVVEGATYRFASEENKRLFEAEPGKYRPQYGGYCAAGMAGGYKAPTDPMAWTIMHGKLYLNYSAKVVDMWKSKAKENIAKADRNWEKVR